MYAQRYVPALYAFIDYCRTYGRVFGVMVTEYVETDGINELFETGDVIITFNGDACVSYESYIEIKVQCAENTYSVQVLRMGETGEMALVSLELSKDMPRVCLNTVVYPPEQ